MTTPLHVTFVCTGNICRSPMGEVILRDLLVDAGIADLVTVDSAGTTSYEVGRSADPRAVAELRRRGYDGTGHVARQFHPDWFGNTDLVLAADEGHVRALRRWARTDAEREQVHLMREFDPAAVAAGTLEVDDPWYGDEQAFERCFDEVEAACRGVVDHLRERLDP
ncbi:MAG: low molecular weight protein-tyrosine-phosphatase [Lapillicoccus sp.]